MLKIAARATEIKDAKLEDLRKELIKYAEDVCKDAEDTPLPPFRDINHRIPIIDESKVYPVRPARCPEKLKPLWRDKRAQYLKSGRWVVRSGSNASPMMYLAKPTRDLSLQLRCVVDLRARNANTKRMASPLPDMDTILRNVVSHKYKSMLDLKGAYEQIRIVEEDEKYALMNTPEGTLGTRVMQQGDLNAGSTYQALMTHIFREYIGVFMDVYLDDIVIY